MERGRPTIYTREIADTICAQLADGRTLKEICRAEGMPDEATVRNWAATDRDGFFPRYTQSRDVGLDAMADELLTIADDGSNDWIEKNDPENPGYVFNGEHHARSRLRVDTRKWYLAKMAPKRYSERLALENADDKPFQIDDGGRADKLETLITKVAARVAGTDDSELV